MTSPERQTHAHAQPLRMRLLLLGASGLLPLLLVLAWGINHLVEERRAQAEVSVLDLSRALGSAVDAELRSVAALLDHIGHAESLENADFHSFQLEARRTVERLGWDQVTLNDPEGRIILRTNEAFGQSDPTSLEPTSLARVIKNRELVVTHLIEAGPQAKRLFGVRVPVMREGQLAYVLSAFISADVVQAVLTQQNAPAGSVSSVFDQSNRQVARSRPAASSAPSPMLQEMLARGDAQGAGVAVTREGVKSYAGYTRLPGSGWVVTVGHSVEEANKGLYALLRAVALGLAASVGLAVWLAWVSSRGILAPIETLKEGAAALGRGQPVKLPPMDIVELDDVAVALTEAAADRDRAAAQVAEALRTAEEANRSKDQFMAVLGHELRNPLAPIANAVQLMKRKGDDSTANERRIIERQMVHVTRLVDDLLDVSRITSGRLTIRREPVRVDALLTQVVEAIEQAAHGRSLTLDLEPGLQDAWVAGDEVRLVQVFNNLLVNAIKFTAPGAAIHVKAMVVGDEVEVDVQDAGVGLSRDELSHIFELFYQAPQSIDRARGGLGLGLPIVKSLVRMHGGTVHAASAGPGRGTCFSVRLPRCDAPVPGAEAQPAITARASGSVLVVDDNEDAADTCATLLEMAGYGVQVVYTPEAALEALRSFKPDLAILDIGLPGMSGYELAEKMRSTAVGYRGRLIALTGYGQASDVAASKRAGFDAHLTKPFDADGLIDLVDRLVKEATGSQG